MGGPAISLIGVVDQTATLTGIETRERHHPGLRDYGTDVAVECGAAEGEDRAEGEAPDAVGRARPAA